VVDEGFQTDVPGIFAAGNVVHVYDLVDWVTEAGLVAGKRAARLAMAPPRSARHIRLQAGANVRYVVPHLLDPEQLAEGPVRLQLRVRQPIEQPVWVEVHDGDHLVARSAERYARPGEMVTIVLSGKHYDAVRLATTLTVQVVER